MKGTEQFQCSACRTPKGDRDRNAGWYEVKPRGTWVRVLYFCPDCSATMLVALDRAMDLGDKSDGVVLWRKYLVEAFRVVGWAQRVMTERREGLHDAMGFMHSHNVFALMEHLRPLVGAEASKRLDWKVPQTRDFVLGPEE